MADGIGQPPAGTPGWLVVVWGVVVLLVAVFGAGFGRALLAGLRNWRAGIATRETEAREQERGFRAEQITAQETQTEAMYQRLRTQLADYRQQMDDQGETIRAQGQEIEELKRAQREQYAREQRIMDGLIHHAGWDFRARTYLPEDFPEPPPLLPPGTAAAHSQEWGPAPG